MVDDNKYKKTVSVIIPNFNGEGLLKENLPSLIKAYENTKNSISEIIIVDDCSTDKSVKYIKDKYPQIKLVKHTKNRGFSSTVNTGARSSKGKYIALLNTDVIPENNFLVATLEHFSDRNMFAVSLHEKGYSWARGKYINGFVEHEPGVGSKNIHESFWANGGSGVFRRSMWMKLKGMDEELFSPFYWEDIDLSYRAMKRGWKVLWEPNACVEHGHESTIGRLSRNYRENIQERNQLLFIWKNITSPNLIKKHISGLFKRVSKHPGYLKIVFLAFFKLRKVLRARKIEKKECRISDEVIFARFAQEEGNE